MKFDTEDAFKNFFESQLKRVIDIVSDKIHEQLRLNISLYTYGYTPGIASPSVKVPINEMYQVVNGNETGEPSYEFRDEAWIKQQAKALSGKIIGSIFYDYSKLSAPTSSRPFTHGNFYQGKDRRVNLADLLNVSGYDLGNDFGGKEREPYFDITLKWIKDNFSQLVNNAFRKVGITGISEKVELSDEEWRAMFGD